MDNFNNRDREEAIFAIMRQPMGGAEDSGAQDGSQFLNKSDPGMELELRAEAQTNNECDDDSQIGAPLKSGEVY